MSGADGGSGGDRGGQGAGSLPHLLDPLSAGEFRQAAAILRRDRGVGETWRFASIELAEPAKEQLAELDAGAPAPDRTAIAVCWNRADGQACRAVVALPEGTGPGAVRS